jgi:histidyl-tRNA synthetase
VSESQKPVLAKTQAIRGTRDLLPTETEIWQFVERVAQDTFRTFGFGEIRLPMFERMSLFERAVGAETDIVSKEMFNWIDDPEISNALRNLRTLMQDTNSIPSVDGSPAGLKLEALARSGAFNNLAERVRIALRPEATASVCRAYIEREMQTLPQPVKLYYMGPMFRRERPQKGRYRQFFRIGAEAMLRTVEDLRSGISWLRWPGRTDGFFGCVTFDIVHTTKGQFWTCHQPQ